MAPDEHLSVSDPTCKQLSLADLKAARDHAARLEAEAKASATPPLGGIVVPRSASSDTTVPPPLLQARTKAFASAESTQLQTHVSNAFTATPDRFELVRNSDWDMTAVCLVLGLAIFMFLVWLGIVVSINVYLPFMGAFIGLGMGAATHQLMGAGRAYAIFATVLTLLVNYGVLIVGILMRGELPNTAGNNFYDAHIRGYAMLVLMVVDPRPLTLEAFLAVPATCHIFLWVGAVVCYFFANRD